MFAKWALRREAEVQSGFILRGDAFEQSALSLCEELSKVDCMIGRLQELQDPAVQDAVQRWAGAMETIHAPREIRLARVVRPRQHYQVLRQVDLGIAERSKVLSAEKHGGIQAGGVLAPAGGAELTPRASAVTRFRQAAPTCDVDARHAL